MAIGLLPDKATEVKTDPGDSEKEVNPGQNPPSCPETQGCCVSYWKTKEGKIWFPTQPGRLPQSNADTT